MALVTAWVYGQLSDEIPRTLRWCANFRGFPHHWH